MRDPGVPKLSRLLLSPRELTVVEEKLREMGLGRLPQVASTIDLTSPPEDKAAALNHIRNAWNRKQDEFGKIFNLHNDGEILKSMKKNARETCQEYFSGNPNPADGLKLENCEPKELRLVFKFLLPFLTPDRGLKKRIPVKVAHLIIKCWKDELKVNWEKVLFDQVEQMRGENVSYISPWLSAIYRASHEVNAPQNLKYTEIVPDHVAVEGSPVMVTAQDTTRGTPIVAPDIPRTSGCSALDYQRKGKRKYEQLIGSSFEAVHNTGSSSGQSSEDLLRDDVAQPCDVTQPTFVPDTLSEGMDISEESILLSTKEPVRNAESSSLEPLQVAELTPGRALHGMESSLRESHSASYNGDLQQKVVSTPGVSERLVSVLLEAKRFFITNNCVRILAFLAKEDNPLEIISIPGMLEGLVRFLNEDGRSAAKMFCERNLANLANVNYSDLLQKIKSTLGVLKGLTNGLWKFNNGPLQYWCAHALENWVCNSSHCCTDVSNFPPAIEVLVYVLKGSSELRVRNSCAMCLGTLAIQRNPQFIKRFKENSQLFQKLLKGLVSGLTNADDVLRESCAWALSIFSTLHREPEVDMDAFSQALEGLVSVLAEGSHPKAIEHCARTLWTLTDIFDCDFREEIVSIPGVLEGLVSVLTKGSPPEAMTYCAMILWNLAGVQNFLREYTCDFQRKIISTPGVLEVLGSVLAESSHPKAMTFCAMTLSDLANEDMSDLLQKIKSTPGVLKGLRNGLSKYDNPLLQYWCGHALERWACNGSQCCTEIGNLPPGLVERLVAQLVKASDLCARNSSSMCFWTRDQGPEFTAPFRHPGLFEGVMKGLVSGLTNADDKELRESCARALSIFTELDDELRQKISTYPPAYEGLGSVLVEGSHPEAMTYCARTLSDLAHWTTCNLSLWTIISTPGVVKGLMDGLSKYDNPLLQHWCALALANFARYCLPCREIRQFPSAIEGLVGVLAKARDLRARTSCSTCLGELAMDSEITEQFENPELFQGVLEELVSGLTKADDEKLRESCARALWIISNSDHLARKIGNFSPAGLVSVLTEGSHPKAMEYCAKTLCNLADKNDCDFRRKIISTPGVLEGLGSVLAEGSHYKAVKYCAKTLCNLADEDNCACQRKIISTPGVLEGLGSVFAEGSHPKAMEHGAKTLWNLANENKCDFRSKIISTPGVLEGLGSVLAQGTFPATQICEWILCTLTGVSFYDPYHLLV